MLMLPSDFYLFEAYDISLLYEHYTVSHFDSCLAMNVVVQRLAIFGSLLTSSLPDYPRCPKTVK